MPLTRSEQARLNGAKSRGPKTAEGKQRSAMNAAKHGLVADKVIVLQNEQPDLFDQLFNAFVEKFKPQDDAERELVLHAAVARWRLRRVWQLESALFDMKMDEQRDLMKKTFDRADEGVRQAMAFRSLAEDSASFTLLSRYETRLSREYDRAIRALERARALSSADPEPVADPMTSTEPAITGEEFPNEPENTRLDSSCKGGRVLSVVAPPLNPLNPSQISNILQDLPDAA
jgi:hypothetical protein